MMMLFVVANAATGSTFPMMHGSPQPRIPRLPHGRQPPILPWAHGSQQPIPAHRQLLQGDAPNATLPNWFNLPVCY